MRHDKSASPFAVNVKMKAESDLARPENLHGVGRRERDDVSGANRVENRVGRLLEDQYEGAFHVFEVADLIAPISQAKRLANAIA